ncbi:MAG: chorismate mutase [Bacillota bacterium]|nr:chorismate mutase [Bacillota bacterium]
MKDLKEIRDEIDSLDKELVKLFERRMIAVGQVAEYKKKNNIPILNVARERDVIEKNKNYLKNKEYEKEVAEFFECVMEISRGYQSGKLSDCCDDLAKVETQEGCVLNQTANGTALSCTSRENSELSLRVGFQGVPGSFSEQALQEYFGEDTATKNYNQFEDVFIGLKNDEVDFGVLPIENSSTGGISEVYDLLRKYGFFIVGEKNIKVDHNLLGIKGTTLEDIKEVYSHPQAFQQSSEFLKDFPQWKLIPYYNTAKSAEYIKNENSPYMTAISSRKCAQLYDLDIIKENINYNTNNHTKFIIIGKNLDLKEECNKISIILSVPHKVGSLYCILDYFAKNNLNMLKIESRPLLDKSWEYFFYIDFEGNLKNDAVKEAVNIIESHSSYFKLLGNYVKSN